MITLSELARSCPLVYWVRHHKHAIRIELVTGQTFVLRSTLGDLKGFKCTADILRKNTPWLQDKPHDTLAALADLVDARMLQLAQDQLAISQYTTEIITHTTMRNFSYVRTTLVPALALILLGYEEAANMSGWPGWLQNCIDYCKWSEKK